MNGIPDPIYLYHITPIANLKGVLDSGCLISMNGLAAEGVEVESIAYQSIQGRRSVKEVTCGKGGTLHDYVPFYFAPRSPMLMTINGGNVEGCDYRQEDIVHLVSTVATAENEGYDFVFYDMNAAVGYSTAYDDLAQLDEIDWDLFFEPPKIGGYCKYWNSRADIPKYVYRMETRQAEFVVYKKFQCEHLHEIGVMDKKAESAVRKLVTASGLDLPINIQPDWYY